MVHNYTVQITRAMYSQESFELFQKYEKVIHNKEDKNP